MKTSKSVDPYSIPTNIIKLSCSANTLTHQGSVKESIYEKRIPIT